LWLARHGPAAGRRTVCARLPGRARHRAHVFDALHSREPDRRRAVRGDRSAHSLRVKTFWARFRCNRGAVAGLAVLGIFLVMAFGAPMATTYNPELTRLDQKLLDPT